MAAEKIVVTGAAGLVGSAALRHFGAASRIRSGALSRRKPRSLQGATERWTPKTCSVNGSGRRGRADCCRNESLPDRRPANARFHCPPCLDGVVAGIDLDIAPAHHRAVRDVAPQLHPVRQPDRQRARRQGWPPPASACPRPCSRPRRPASRRRSGRAWRSPTTSPRKACGCPVGSRRRPPTRR